MSSHLTAADRDGLRIRRAEAGDAKALTTMVRRSRAYEGPYRAMVDGYVVGPDYIETHQVFLASDPDGALLGFYALVVADAELDLMFVADAAQGRGVGRRLIAHMLDQARTAGLSGVRVISHPPAEGFYQSVGARRTGMAPAISSKIFWERPELLFAVPREG
ncbi:GNAT family N-acetyltransferase [Streptomyces sp. NPDC057638]|uniref:GNAT family N-acetyltransferase n=1 Tax=Streptomyces sp. NPDC057638 TaxID=3346190 RepID=UPI00367DD8DF